MAINILNTPVNVTATNQIPSISAGNNRLVLLTVCMYNGAGNVTPPSGVTVNGVAGTFLAGDNTTQSRVCTTTFYFKESEVASISGQTISTTGQSGNVKSMSVMSLQDVTQTTPVNVNKAYASTSSTLTMSLTRSASSYTVLLGYTSTAAQTMTLANPARVGTINFASGTLNYGYGTDSSQTVNSTVAGSNNTSAHVVNFIQAPSASVTDVNTNEVVRVGSTGNTFTYTGFTGDPTAITIGSKSATSVSATGGSGTFSFPDYIDGQTYPLVGGSQTFTATYSAEQASLSVTLSAKVGHSIATVSGAVDDDDTYLGYHLTLANNDTIDYVSTELTVNADGGITTSTPGIYQLWHRATSTGVMTLLNVTVNEAGVVSVSTGSISLGMGLGIGI